MSAAASAYRDDGPVAELFGRVLPSSATAALPRQLLALCLLFAGLAADGSTTGLPTGLGVAAYVVTAGSAASAAGSSRLGWLVAPLLRAGEYGFVLWLGWRAGPTAAAAVYGLLAALAYHHYDIIHRLVHRRGGPPAWVGRLGGGWDVRMVVLVGAAVAGAFAPAVTVLAGWCATLFASQSLVSWTRAAREGRLGLPAAGTGEN